MVERQHVELESMAAQVSHHLRELQMQFEDQRQQQEQQQDETRTGATSQQAFTDRLDDITLRVGALKVKSDSLEGRLSKADDRIEAVRKPISDVHIEQHVENCYRKKAHEVESRIEVIEQRVESMWEACENAVEQ